MAFRGRHSLSFQFTIVVLSIIILISGVLSAVFLYNLYSVTYKLTRNNVEESIGRLKDYITGSLERYADMLENTSRGISALFNDGKVSREDLAAYFGELRKNIPDAEMLYFANNTKWNEKNGYWASNPVWVPDADWDQTKRPWFLNAKKASGDITYSEPYLDAYSGGIIISLSKTVYDKNGKDIGVIAADIMVTKLNTAVTRSLIFPEQKLYLLNSDGLYITNLEPSKVMNENFFKETNFEKYYKAVILSEEFHVEANNTDFHSVRIPEANWYLVSVMPKSTIYSEINKVILRLILISLIVLAAAACVTVAYSYYTITRPMREIQQVADSLSQMDFSTGFKTIKQDEIGEMMKSLDDFLEKLKKSFALFSQNASMLSTAVFDLSASAKEITTTANEQSASVAEIVSTMESNKNLSSQVSSKTVEVADLASKTQELSRRGANLRDDNENMMFDIKNKNAKIVEEIKNLADMLSRIDESVQLIDTIADQTKLIAFNAALEASSSGEAGARFAVVAGEIRRFADNVAESVIEIKEKITELQEASGTLISEANNGSRAIDSGYNKMVEQKEVFENIVEVSQNVAMRSQQISNLSKQQELAAEQIFVALKEISSGVNQFVISTSSTSATAEKLNSMSIELKETLAKYQTKK